MNLLAIETSCDETAVAVLHAEGVGKRTHFTVLGNALLSQIAIHQEYGGVFPALAKRAHAQNLVPLLEAALEEAELLYEDTQSIPDEQQTRLSKLLEREPELDEQLLAFLKETEPPAIDAIAVTAGPGLAPALWVGVNFARALALAWDKPLIAVNHLEGHIFASLLEATGERTYDIADIPLPLLALLISGGHTELVLMPEWLSYEKLGATRDDAAGEAFDKVARMLGLPYPGGPEISRCAERARKNSAPSPFTLPRPMLDNPSLDFSFSGLKTAVLYLLKARPVLDEFEKEQLAREFEDAVTEVLLAKTEKALEATGATTLALGGGVAANTHIRRVFEEVVATHFPDVTLRLPALGLTGDNAIMIGIAGYYRAQEKKFIYPETLAADGNLSLA